ncbi:ABC transporter permease [Candidatus Woesearchaeota archaeon]|nr:ABC transporter permease [Candidatus Woesearchaeota archaeon]
MKSLNDSLYVAYKYLIYNKVKTLILIFVLSIIILIPFLLNVVVSESQMQLNSRADATPLILGEKGNSLDLAINSLYFISKRPSDIVMNDVNSIDEDLAYSIPLFTRFSALDQTIVGTTVDYIDFRGLIVDEGRMFTRIGEAVLGSKIADELNLDVGDTIISSPENLFDLAGQYPLEMKVVGILKLKGSPDDEVIFTDILSTWAMTGKFHGHEDLSETQDESVILTRDEEVVVGNAKLKTYNVITQENLKSFHFHGNKSSFPVTSAIIIPNSEKAKDILLGRPRGNLQLIQPKEIVQELIDSIMRIKKTLDIIILTIGFATLMTIGLVFFLSIRLREKEIKTIFRLGCSKSTTAKFIVAEIGILIMASLILAFILFVIIWSQSDSLIRILIT